ncbi:MAG: FtsX-like permease family protein, partial [Bacteroidota bacterium]
MRSKEAKPPSWAISLLKGFVSDELEEEIVGDLLEAYSSRRNRYNKILVDLWFILDVFKFLRPYSMEKYSRSKQFLPLYKNYLKIACRNMMKRSAFTLLNITGLCLGITCVFLVGLYLNHEKEYDKVFPEAKNTYRLVNKYRDQVYSCMPFPDYYGSDQSTQMRLINQLKTYNGVRDACHFVTNTSAIGPNEKAYVGMNGKRFALDNFLYTSTGSSFHAVFPQVFVQGSAETAFSAFDQVVITAELASLFFGKDWKTQEILYSSISIGSDTYMIAGIVENPPGNIHFDFNLIVHTDKIPSWGAYTYFTVNDQTTGNQILTALNADIDLVYPGYTDDILSKGAQILSLLDIHFTNSRLYELKPPANQTYLKIFGILGVVILLIIWTNYANLSIAIYAPRQRELGVRKVMGARKRDIRFQIIAEALLTSIVCFPLIWSLTYLAIPFMNQLLSIEVANIVMLKLSTCLVLLSLLIITGLISGWYPAMTYSKRALLGLFKSGKRNEKVRQAFSFRTVLLTFQFFMIVALISISTIIIQQLRYIQDRPSGFEKEGVVFFPVNGAEKYNQILSILSRFPEIKAIGNGMIPGQEMYNQTTY